MKILQLVRRAAGKPPGYLLKRGWREISSRLGARRFLRRAKAVTASEIARRAGAVSLWQIWSGLDPEGFLLSRADRAWLAEHVNGRRLPEASALGQAAEKILRHEFNLLGSGPVQLGPEIDWSFDFKSGRRWSLKPSQGIDYAELDQPSDVKVPWELSRCQHLTTLGQAWLVHRDERFVREFEAQIGSWIGANPIGLGVNWACTMDVALRAVSWVWALALMQDAPLEEEFREQILLELYRHGLWIPKHLEIGAVNGNHFISDALGLVACGAVFSALPEGRRWLDLGARLLEEEIQLQIDPEGVDIEASVPYHRLVLEIFLTGRQLLAAIRRPVSADYDLRLKKMFEFVHAYVTPEGLSPVVGDADDGRAVVLGLDSTDIRDHRYLLSTGAVLFERPEWMARAGRVWADSLWLLGSKVEPFLKSEAAEAEACSRAFSESGFHILRSPDQYLFVDAGPVGFKGLGGHGHNDCLSFEWHACGKPLLTDSGAFVYTASPDWRNRFRSTEFHNTIRVDRQEINRFPSPLALWSLRDDARPFGVRFIAGGQWDVLEAGHDGYRRLDRPVTVTRRFEFNRNAAEIRIVDRLEGVGEHWVEVFFHAAPGARPLKRPDQAVSFCWPDGMEAVIADGRPGQLRWETREGWFSPSYGVKIARPTWVACATLKLPAVLDWTLSAVAAEAPGGELSQAGAAGRTR